MNNSTPTVHFQMTPVKFTTLVKMLRQEMNAHIEGLDPRDRHEVLLFEANYWLLLDWMATLAKGWNKANLKLKTDLIYAKAFIEYWTPVELPVYEDILLRKVLLDLGSRIDAMAAKRQFVNL